MKLNFEFIKKLPLFEAIPESDLPELFHCLGASVKEYPKDSFIRIEGDPVDFIGIVLEGTIQILSDDYNGKRSITAALSCGQVFAEAFACADVAALPISILAATPCSIMFLKKERVLPPCESACRFHNLLIHNLLRIVAAKNLLLSRKLSYISHKTTSEKLMAFLSDQAKQQHSMEFTIPYDRQALADYLGVERSALSTELNKLQRQGILKTRRNYFKLLSSSTNKI